MPLTATFEKAGRSAHLCSLRLVAGGDAVEDSSELPVLQSVGLQPTFHHISRRGGHPGNGPWRRGESRSVSAADVKEGAFARWIVLQTQITLFTNPAVHSDDEHIKKRKQKVHQSELYGYNRVRCESHDKNRKHTHTHRWRPIRVDICVMKRDM